MGEILNRRRRETGVPCPACGRGRLVMVCSCLATTLACSACRRPFTLAELARLLDEEGFSAVADLVGDRLSDRV